MKRGPQFFPERPPPPVQRVCVVCGRPAIHGFGVAIRKGREGRWFCGEHKPK
ncbi:hypothetical protein [Microcystis phage Mwe-JY08]